MKKLFAGILAAAFCLAITAPVLAEVKVEGMIQTDVYYWEQSAERVLGGLPKVAPTAAQLAQDDWSTVRMNMPQPSNRITVRYTGEDKVVNGYIQIRAGGSRANGLTIKNADNGAGLGETNMTWEYAWIDWHLTPGFYLRLGRQDQIFANAYAPGQNLGHNDGHIICLGGFGNMTGASRDGVRAFIKFNDNIRMEVAMYDPNTENLTNAVTGLGTTELALPRATPLAGNAREATVLPRFDLSLPMQFGNFSIEPGFTWSTQDYDQVFAGSDDSFDIWGLTLGMKAGFGPFSIAGEITYGENLASGSYVGSVGPGGAVAYNPVGTNANVRKIEDGETLMAYLQLAFDFGPFAIEGVIGYGNFENDGDPALAAAVDAAQGEWTQWAYGLAFPIKVTKTFMIKPSIYYYDYDDDAVVGGRVGNTDRGSELIIGATFNLTF